MTGTGGIGVERGREGDRLVDSREEGEGSRSRIGSRWARIRASGRGRVRTRTTGTTTSFRRGERGVARDQSSGEGGTVRTEGGMGLIEVSAEWAKAKGASLSWCG